MTNEGSYNRLKSEQSTYLKQHAENPVHWFPYGPEALQKAKNENKPIFLSIGYSSCHWCHVMADESFQSPEVAEVLNKNFINIKVDREEFPDIDAYYQQACQLFSHSGGWPLSAFLLPDMRPYFVGTYFPKIGDDKRAGFKDLALELSRAFTDSDDQVEENANKVTEALKSGLTPKDKVEFEGRFPVPMAVIDAIKTFKDEKFGGYGEAPKFPAFPFYEWALEQMLEGMIEREEGNHIIFSLERMLMGGMYDHARGGIHRYTTDEAWMIPHFEKMLYDQAGLLRVLSKMSLLYPSPLVFDALFDTLEYLETEMMSEDGHFFSSQDADSEGVEGLYFTFSLEEFEDAIKELEDEDEEVAKNHDKILKWFQITEKGNFDSNLNVISLDPELKEEIFTPSSWEIIRKVRKAIKEERKNRIPPGTDNKGVASWNFMLLSSLVDVIQYCPVEAIKNRAHLIFNKSLEGAFKIFLSSGETKEDDGNTFTKIRHTNTKEDSLPYFEDYVTFAELQLRVFEISGNKVFKENFLDTLSFIHLEFIDEEKILTRAKLANNYELYPNQKISSFDQSFKSSSALLIGLTRRAEVLFSDKDLLTPLEKVIEESIHESLKSPINSGEALRALTYPTDAYRVIKVPKPWILNNSFIGFIRYFLPRFVLDFHEENSDEEKAENWQICSLGQCELQGSGIKGFIETLTPDPKKEENDDKA